MERLLRLPEVRQVVGLKTTAIYDGIRKGNFPRSVLIGKRAVAWRASEISEWIGTRSAQGARTATQLADLSMAAEPFEAAELSFAQMRTT